MRRVRLRELSRDGNQATPGRLLAVHDQTGGAAAQPVYLSFASEAECESLRIEVSADDRAVVIEQTATLERHYTDAD
ncbi:hypothetical protein [Stenotrophomonas hibiscicola]|uniref:hypothetical protein n=1 Tax=Stenotrophomonas hibiscicola TaxID=86189 RepID=UPI00035E43B8|nr:hypothetical protein [[Pseudomonas] hibiscicola]